MNRPETKRSTGNEIQRTLFLSSLRQELNKIADIHTKIVSSAREYLSQGMNVEETKELLMIDGFDSELIKSCMNQFSHSIDPANIITGKRWGFDVEDTYGRITTSADLGKVITAASEDEAWEKAEEFITTEDSDKGMERIVEVYELE